MTVPVSVNGHSTGTMSMPSEFNIAKSKLSISDFPFTYGVSCKVQSWSCPKNIPEKEHSGTFKNSKLFPENLQKMEQFK